MRLNEKIIKIRVDLQNTDIKKSGKNKFAGFTYFELSDFLPTLNKLMLDNSLNDCITIKDGYMTLILISGDESQEYSMPFHRFEVPVNKQGKQSMQEIQYIGAINTYCKRYLYLNAFGITDGEVIDALDNDTPTPKQTKTVSKQTTPIQQKEDGVTQSDELKETRSQLIKLCEVKGINPTDVASEFGINAHSGLTAFRNAIATIKSR